MKKGKGTGTYMERASLGSVVPNDCVAQTRVSSLALAVAASHLIKVGKIQPGLTLSSLIRAIIESYAEAVLYEVEQFEDLYEARTFLEHVTLRSAELNTGGRGGHALLAALHREGMQAGNINPASVLLKTKYKRNLNEDLASAPNVAGLPPEEAGRRLREWVEGNQKKERVAVPSPEQMTGVTPSQASQQQEYNEWNDPELIRQTLANPAAVPVANASDSEVQDSSALTDSPLMQPQGAASGALTECQPEEDQSDAK